MTHKKFYAVEQPILVWKNKMMPPSLPLAFAIPAVWINLFYSLSSHVVTFSLSCVYYYLSGASSHLFSLAEVFIRCCFLPFLLSFAVYLVLFMLLFLTGFHMLSTSLYILYACFLGCPLNPSSQHRSPPTHNFHRHNITIVLKFVT